MTTETIGVTVTYKEPITFHLRMISVTEENQLRQKMFGITEAEKAEKSYQNNVAMLADLSVKLPDGMYDEAVPKCPVDQAVKSYFAEQSILKERIAEYAVRGYFIKLQPDVSFL